MITTRYKLITAILTAMLCAVTGIHVYGADKPVLSNGYVRVINPKIPLTIPDAYLEFSVGDRLELFQENKDYFIALANLPGQGKVLCAFTAKKGRGKVAWVTPEKDMFFGYRTPSCTGKFYLKRNEKLRVLDHDDSGYNVVIERFGREATLWIPTNSAAYVYVPPPTPKSKALQTNSPPAPSDIKPAVNKIQKVKKTPPPQKKSPVPKKILKKTITTNPPIKTLKPRRISAKASEPTNTTPAPQKIILSPVIKTTTPTVPKPEPPSKSTLIPTTSEPQKAKTSQPEPKPESPLSQPLPEPKQELAPQQKSETIENSGSELSVDSPPESNTTEQVTQQNPLEKESRIPPEPVSSNTESTVQKPLKSPTDFKEENKPEKMETKEQKASKQITKEVEIFKINGPIPGEKGWEELQKETEQAHWTIRIAITEFILLALLIFLLVHREVKGRRERAKLVAQLNEQAREQVQPFVQATKSTKHDEQVTLSGVVGPMTICMIAQFLYAERETGRLTVSGRVVDNIGALAFLNGHIVDAAYNDIVGEDAVYKILALGEGEFMFIQGSLKGFTKTCDCDTMSLLLNAHRMMDEQRASEKPKEPEIPAKEITPTPPAND